MTRAGRISSAQERAIAEYGPRFMIPYSPSPLDLATVFKRTAPTVLEIGFGMGETTARIAAAHTDVNFVGVEVHTPGVGALLKHLAASALDNVRIIQHDAVEVVEQMIVPAALSGVHVFFPDPWHKARHQKRRLIQPAFASLLANRLLPDGYIHCATDWQDYAEQMLLVLEAEPALRNTTQAFASAANPLLERPRTKFQERGLRLGHGVWDLVFVRRSASESGAPHAFEAARGDGILP